MRGLAKKGEPEARDIGCTSVRDRGPVAVGIRAFEPIHRLMGASNEETSYDEDAVSGCEVDGPVAVVIGAFELDGDAIGVCEQDGTGDEPDCSGRACGGDPSG